MKTEETYQPMGFKEIAAPYIAMGIEVFPLKPQAKEPALAASWKEICSKDPAQIATWDLENPDYNVALVAKPDSICILEFDVRPGWKDCCEGHDVPATRIHKSGKGFAHVIFLNTPYSNALGNCSALLPDFCHDPNCEKADRVHKHEWFSFRSDWMYVVGPGSTHPNGNKYAVAADVAPLPIPDWLVDWIRKHKTETKKFTGKDYPPVADDFDFEDFLAHYGIEVVAQDDPWYTTRVCPVAGYRHKHSIHTAFRYDGSHLGFKCFAQACEGNSMTVGGVVRHLNQDHEPYPHLIWPEDDAEIDSEWMDAVDEASRKEIVPVIKSEPPKEKCYRKDCHCGLKHEDTSLSTETRKMMDEALAETDAGEDDESEELLPAISSGESLSFEELLLAFSLKSRESSNNGKGIYTMDGYLGAEPAQIPEEAMYGNMKKWAEQTELSMSVAYPAILAAYSAIPKYDDVLGVRFNLYAALLMPVSGQNPFTSIDGSNVPYSFIPIFTKTTWANGQVSQTCLLYDSMTNGPCAGTYNPSGSTFFNKNYTSGTTYPFVHGSVVQKQEYDYGSGAPGPLLRQTNTQFQWQNNGTFLTANLLSKPTSVTIQNGSATQMAQTTYAYDETGNGSVCTTLPCGNLTSVTRWLNGSTSPKTQYVYNSNGMRTKMFDPLNNQTQYTYDSTGMFLSKVQYPNTGTTAHIELFNYDSNTGLLNWHKDQNVQQTSYGYDSMRRLTSVAYPDGGSDSYSYNDSVSSPSFTFTKAIVSGTNFSETGFVDGLGRPKQTKTAVPTSTCSLGYSYVDTGYDNKGRTFSASNSYCTTSDATYGLRKNYYDALNRVTSVVEQDGSTVTTDYSNFPCITVTDEAGKKRKSCSDGLGRMTSVSEDPNVLNYQTSYAYDALDNLLSVTQSGSRQRTFTYDSLARLTQATNPESGTINYTYDANGNVKTKTDARNISTTWLYDALNRFTSKTYSDGTPGVIPAYDMSNPFGLAATNTVGRMVGLWESDGVWLSWKAFSYDPMGRVATQWDCLPLAYPNCQGAYSTAVTYDFAGDLTSLTYPSGRKLTYAYNNAMQPTQVRFDSFNGTSVGYNYLSSASYAPTGAATSLTLGSGVIESASYNNRLQPCNLQAATGTFTWLNRTNNFYPTPGVNCQPGSGGNNGNVMSIVDNLQPNRTQTFGYDSLNRIASAQTQGTSGVDCWAQSFGYDAWANLLSATPTRSGCPMTQLSVGVNANNQITNPGFSYDAAGDVLTDGMNTYAYDGDARIKTLNGSGATYIYSGDGQRVSKHIGSDTTDYIQFGGQPIAERKANGDWSDYIYAGSRRLARADSYEDRLHIYGTECNCGFQWYQFKLPGAGGLAGYTIRQGDLLMWRQWQQPTSTGGLNMAFTDGGAQTYGVLFDQDGYDINTDGLHSVWHYRRVNMNLEAGRTVSLLTLSVNGTLSGRWDLYFNDIVLVSQDGTVHPIYTRETAISLAGFGSSGMTGTGYEVNHDSNAGVYSQVVATSFYHGDHLGSARLTTSENGYPTWSSTFLPFGQEWNPQVTVNHYKFTGKERDSESGLDNFGARYNSSQYGRFMTPDPLWVKADRMLDPQRLNLYAYTRNNPLRFSDPTGMDVSIGNCPGDRTITQCFAAVQQGLMKSDRSHVQLVEGDGKNGFKKGEYGISVDKDYKSTSANFRALQYAANDHSVKAVTNFETTGFQLHANVGVSIGNRIQLESLTKAAGVPVTLGQGLGGYTFYQKWGKPQAGVVYSLTSDSQIFALSDTALDMTVNFYHELQHVVLGDFGRNALAGQHDALGVNEATRDAENEAIQNAAQH